MDAKMIRELAEACARLQAEQLKPGASSIVFLVDLLTPAIERALTELASKAAADEREACAKVAKQYYDCAQKLGYGADDDAYSIMLGIRARSR